MQPQCTRREGWHACCHWTLDEKGTGDHPKLMDGETDLQRLRGMTMITQLFPLRTRTETESSNFMASLFLLSMASQPQYLRTLRVMSDKCFVSVLQT